MPRWRFFLLCSSVLILSISCSGTRTSKEKAVREQPVPVRVRKANAAKMLAEIPASGTVEAMDTINLAFQVAGKVTHVSPEEGGAVTAGQILAEIDPIDYQYALEAATAQAGVVKANLDKARVGAREQELEQARIAFSRAEDEYQRMKILFDKKSLAPNDFKKVEAAYLAAGARYSEVKEGARKEDKAAAEKAYEQAQVQEKVARKRLADTKLLSPVTGRVARRGINPGELVAPGIPVITVMNLTSVKVRVGVPEAEIGGVREGQEVSVMIPSLGEKSFQGKVMLVGVSADPATRTYTVKINIPNPERILRAGMVAEARIRSDRWIEPLTVPGEAIVRDPQGATLVYVYFPDQKRVFSRRVDVGTVYGREVEIKTGLTPADLLVVGGQHQVREGALVEASEVNP